MSMWSVNVDLFLTRDKFVNKTNKVDSAELSHFDNSRFTIIKMYFICLTLKDVINSIRRPWVRVKE